MSSVIEANNISKSFESKGISVKILQNITFTLKKGSFSSIFGASGTGKTTLLHILGLIDAFDSGDLSLTGIKIENLSSKDLAHLRASSIGYVFQDSYLLDELTTFENIKLASLISENKEKYNLDDILKTLEITHIKDRYPHQLSQGEKHRVALARAVINLPPILLADEPTGNLNVELKKTVFDLLKMINQNFGITVLIASHDEMVKRYSTENYLLKDGLLLSLNL